MLRTAHCFSINRRVSRSNHNMTWIGKLACTHRSVIYVRQRMNPPKNWRLHFSRILSHDSHCNRWFTIWKLLVYLQQNVNRSFRNERSTRKVVQIIILGWLFKIIWQSLTDHIVFWDGHVRWFVVYLMLRQEFIIKYRTSNLYVDEGTRSTETWS